MKMIPTFLCLSCVGLMSATPATEIAGNVQVLQEKISIEKILVENSLRHSILIAGNPDQKMNILHRMHYYSVPGVSIAIVNKGKIDWISGYGNITNDKASRAIDEHTLFQAGSISKSLTAYGALLLVQQGKIDLDEDVNTYLRSWKIPENEFTQMEKVTLRRLLSHTAGTNVHGFPGYAIDDSIPSILEVLDGVKPLVNTDPVRVIMQPGTKFKYSGGGTTIVQLLIEDITGERFDDWMQTNVLTPLDMSSSTFNQPFSPAHANHAAYGHQGNEKVEGDWHIYPEQAAAGLWTTPTDLAKFLLHIQSTLKTNIPHERYKPLLLHPIFVREMITRQLSFGREEEPGLGFFISQDGDHLAFAHGGQDEGFIASFYAFANRDQGAVIMMNNDAGWGLMREIKNSIADIYGWPNFMPIKKEKVSLNTSILENLKGKFAHQEDQVEVSIINGKPHIHFKRGFVSIVYGFGQPVELFALNDYVYFIQEVGLSIEFVPSSSNIIETVILTHLDKEKAIFKREAQ